MKKLILFSLVLIFSVACDSKTSNQTEVQTESTPPESVIENVNPEQFKTLLDQNAAILLDVRTGPEVDQGYIEGAVNIDLQSADFKDKLSSLDPKQPVLVYCAAGMRSQSAAQIMEELGFTKVYNLEKGIGSWTAAGYELVK